ncbi:MAG: adenylate/guanylate cyclase domain-containing protein, partial [Prochlorothrix sp.]
MLPREPAPVPSPVPPFGLGSSSTTFLSEFLGNSGHFLILKGLSDIALYGWVTYLTDPTEYLLILAMGAQTFYLARPQASRFFGNLLGVSLYTAIDLPMDGWEFFQSLSHLVFWAFSLTIACLQSYSPSPLPHHTASTAPTAAILSPWERWTIPLESMVRMLMLMAFYGVVTAGQSGQDSLAFQWLTPFLAHDSHIYLGASLLLVGVLLGFRQLQIVVQQRQLRRNSQLFQKLARWGMGSHVVNTAVSNPEGLEFQQCDRAVVFMDIRGFTVWCEQTSPQRVARVLNDYYQQVEPIVAHHNPLRITFTADEIMAIYATP